MEAASIPWRPLGRVLVEQGLLSADELELALAEQERTGQRLGETLVQCGFVSGPELSHALAAQYGLELMAETGFGTGLRTEIQRRHETERRGLRPVLSAVDPAEPATEDEVEPEATVRLEESAQAIQAQLEEQWAKLVAAEERLAESHRELTALAHAYDRRRSQATRLAQRARHARERPGLQHEEERLLDSTRELVALAREYDRRRGQAARLAQRARQAREERRLQLAAADTAEQRFEESRREHDDRVAQLKRDLHDREAEAGRLRGELEDSRATVAERDRLLQAAEENRHEFAERIAQLERDAHDSNAELDRIRSELTGARASAAERDRLVEAAEERLVESQRELATRIAQLEGEIGDRDAELDGLRKVLAGKETVGAERDRAVEGLRREAERRRAQAVRFLERARRSGSERDERATRLADEVQNSHAEIERFRSQLAGAEATAAERDDLLEGLRAEADRRRTQAVRFLERARESRSERDDRDDELAAQRERRRAQLVRFVVRVRERDAQVEQLAADVRGCDAELDRLRHELESREKQAEPATPPPPASHLVFAHLPGGYELVEYAGPPPARNTVLELPELDRGRLVVTGLSRSPLPGDSRPCAFVIQAR